MATTVRPWLDFALLQSAAESYWDKASDLGNYEEIQRILKIGCNDPVKLGLPADSPILASATRFTDTQAEWFTANYEIVTHYPNDSSGFSATFFRNKYTGEYTLSFRSAVGWADEGSPTVFAWGVVGLRTSAQPCIVTEQLMYSGFPPRERLDAAPNLECNNSLCR